MSSSEGEARIPTNRRWAAAAATTLVAGLLFGVAACAGDGGRSFMTIGTGGTGGIYYPLGGALAGQLSVRDTARQFTAEVSGGSVENVNRVREGQVELGFALGISVYEAHTGGTDSERPAEELRVVAPLYPNVTHIMVRSGSPARSLADLEGAEISVGPAGSGTEQLSRQLLDAHGLSYDDVRVEYLSFSESSAALRDGSIDAAIISVGYPAAAVLEAATTTDIRLLPVDGEPRDRLLESHPYYMEGTIPGGAYRGVDEDVPTVAMMNWIVGLESLEHEVVESVLRTLEDDREELANVHRMAEQIDLAAVQEAPIPLHPATREWADRELATTPASAEPGR